MTITQEKADKMLSEDMVKYELYVNSICDYITLNQNQFDALVSFTYNLGSGGLLDLTRKKTLPKADIPDRMLLYVHAGGNVLPGLERRRKDERKLFLTPVKEVPMVDNEYEALEYLEEKGRITDKEFWIKALATTKNVNYLIVKWANDVALLEANDIL